MPQINKNKDHYQEIDDFIPVYKPPAENTENLKNDTLAIHSGIHKILRTEKTKEINQVDYVSDYQNKITEAIGVVRTEMNGQTFLNNCYQNLSTEISNKLDSKTYQELTNLELQVQEQIDKKYQKAVRLLFLGLQGNLKLTRRIVRTQLEEFAEHKEQDEDINEKSINFLNHFYNFLAVFSDITQYLVDNSPNGQKINSLSQRALCQILSNGRLQFEEVSYSSQFNLFEIMRELIAQQNADFNSFFWVQTNLEDTPYDINSLDELVKQNVPRKALAKILLKVNNYSEIIDISNYIKILNSFKNNEIDIKQMEKHVNNIIKKLNLTIPLDKLSPEKIVWYTDFKQKLSSQYDTPAINSILQALDMPMSLLSIQEKIDYIKELLFSKYSFLNPYKDREGFVYPTDVLLRLWSPKKIVQNEKFLPQFIKNLYILKKSTREGLSKNILGDSILTLLKQNNSWLDINLKGANNKSIRTLLMDFVMDQFGEDYFRDNVPMVEADVLPEVERATNFNTAGANGYLRKILLDAATTRVKNEKEFIDSLNFAENSAESFYETKENDKSTYKYYFYHSASTAFNDIIRQYFPVLAEDEYAIISNQEYAGMTDVFKNKVKVVDLFTPQNNVTEYVDMIMQELDPQKTKMILLSTKSRFGDAPCSLGNGKANTDYLAEVIDQLRERIKPSYVPIILDGCQSLGRSYDPIAKMKPDIYLTSGKKKLGTDEAGLLALSSDFMQKMQNDKNLTFTDWQATLPIEEIVAMGQALLMLKGKYSLTNMADNLGKFRHKTQMEKENIHMQDLTEYTISKIENFAYSLLLKMQNKYPELANQYLGNLSQQLGAKIIFPTHRNKEDYTGIITMEFSLMSGDKLVKELNKVVDKAGIACRYKNQALRISYDRKTTADIDNLFDKIEDVLLKEFIKKA